MTLGGPVRAMTANGRRLVALGTGLSIATTAAVAGPAVAHSLKDLEDELFRREAFVEIVDRATPEFTLHAADGQPVRLTDYRGKVVVLWFVYTACPDVCPLQSELIASIQQQVNGTPMRDLVQFVSVTTDPARDDPEAMAAYGPARGLDPMNWTFLTSGVGEPEATRRLAERYGLKFTRTDDEYLMHGVVTHLIDKSGHLRARYHGLKFEPANLIVHLNALTNDSH